MDPSPLSGRHSLTPADNRRTVYRKGQGRYHSTAATFGQITNTSAIATNSAAQNSRSHPPKLRHQITLTDGHDHEAAIGRMRAVRRSRQYSGHHLIDQPNSNHYSSVPQLSPNHDSAVQGNHGYLLTTFQSDSAKFATSIGSDRIGGSISRHHDGDSSVDRLVPAGQTAHSRFDEIAKNVSYFAIILAFFHVILLCGIA